MWLRSGSSLRKLWALCRSSEEEYWSPLALTYVSWVAGIDYMDNFIRFVRRRRGLALSSAILLCDSTRVLRPRKWLT